MTALLSDENDNRIAEAYLIGDEPRAASAFLEGQTGDLVGIQPGQRLEVQGPNFSRTLTIPRPELRVDRAGGQVVLRLLETADKQDTEAGGNHMVAQLQLAGSPVQYEADPVGGEAGASRWSFADGALVGGDNITLTLSSPVQGWQMIQRRRLPYARVSLLPGDITGAMDPAEEVKARLLDAQGRERAAGRSFAGHDGQFGLWLHDKAGARVRATAGDTLLVSSLSNRLKIEIPSNSVRWDLETERLEGTGPASSEVRVTKWNPWHLDDAEAPETVSDADGHWAIDLEQQIRPATHFYVTQMLPGGDRLYDCRQVPMLYIEPGSAMVEVQTLWDAEASVSLIREDRTLATASGGGLWSGNLMLVLVDDTGEEVAVLAGDRIEAIVNGSELVMQVPVPGLKVSPMTDRGFTGQTLPETRIGLARDETPLGEVVRSNAAGAFEVALGDYLQFRMPSMGLALGESFQLFAEVPEEHKLRKRFIGLGLSLQLGSSVVQGHAPPGASVRLRRGAEAWADTRADSRGTWSLRWPDRSPLAAGDRLYLQSGDAEYVLELPALSAELRRPERTSGDALSGVATKLAGSGPSDELVDIRAYTADPDPPYSFSASTDSDGRWSLDLQDRNSGLPLLPLEQVRRFEIETRIELEDGPGEYRIRFVLSGPAASRP